MRPQIEYCAIRKVIELFELAGKKSIVFCDISMMIYYDGHVAQIGY
jgi:hypothetical protein